MVSFVEVLGIDDPNFSWSQLEFETCKSSAVRGVIDILGKPTQFVAAPYGLFLRVAEGIDSISNVILSSDSELTGLDRAHALTCAMAQLGGILWSFVTLWVSNPKSAHITKLLTHVRVVPVFALVDFVCLRTRPNRSGMLHFVLAPCYKAGRDATGAR